MSNVPPEVQAQLEEQKKNCPFCKIISGEIESKKVYEDELMIGILDINPRIKGHMLLLPKEHYPILPFLPPETFKHMFSRMSSLVNALKESMLSTGCNVMIANGGVAGQQSPHFLVHLFPRENKDGFDKYGFEKGSFPVSEKFYEQEVSLPIYPGLTEADSAKVIKSIFGMVA